MKSVLVIAAADVSTRQASPACPVSIQDHMMKLVCPSCIRCLGGTDQIAWEYDVQGVIEGRKACADADDSLRMAGTESTCHGKVVLHL